MARLDRPFNDDLVPSRFACSDGAPLEIDEAHEVLVWHGPCPRGHRFGRGCRVRHIAVRKLESVGHLKLATRRLPDRLHPLDAAVAEALAESRVAAAPARAVDVPTFPNPLHELRTRIA